MGVGIGLFAVRDSDGVHFTALGFLLGGIFVYAIWHWYSKAAQVIYKPSKSSHLLGPHTSEIQDIGIKITSGYHDATYFWSTISGTEITENYVFIPLDRISAIMIPKRAFASQEQTNAFITEVRTRAKRIEPY
jgi:hypothetical protein